MDNGIKISTMDSVTSMAVSQIMENNIEFEKKKMMDNQREKILDQKLKLEEQRKKIIDNMRSKFRRERRERSCLYFFKLETAVIIFTFLDILFFALLIMMAQYSYGNDIWTVSAGKPTTDDGHDFVPKENPSTQLNDAPTNLRFLNEDAAYEKYITFLNDESANSKNVKNPQMILFVIVIDFILGGLFILKLWWALRLSWKIINPGQIDEDLLLDELGEQGFRIRVMAKQREYLHNYYMWSVIYQRFAFIQAVSLIWIFWKNWHLMLKLAFITFYSLFNFFYVHERMLRLIEEMNMQIRQFYYVQHDYKIESKKDHTKSVFSNDKRKTLKRGQIVNQQSKMLAQYDEQISTITNLLQTDTTMMMRKNTANWKEQSQQELILSIDQALSQSVPANYHHQRGTMQPATTSESKILLD